MENTRNLKITISYNGSAYHGWQRQNNNITVQQIIEDTLSRITNSLVSANGCSRTDAGVHAREYVFSVKTACPIPCRALVKAMNSMLPHDIAALSCEEMPEDFHARFSSTGKEYVYVINNARVRDVFSNGLELFYPYAMDTGKMNEAAGLFIGEHDFRAFCKAESVRALSSTVRTVYSSAVERDGDKVFYTISGNGFLHNMVRIITGSLIYINEDKLSTGDLMSCLNGGIRENAGVTAPACGLYLNRVFYP